MDVILIRHAEAVPASATSPDAARTLTSRGHRQAADLAAALHRATVRPDVVLSSPAVRCVETARPLTDTAGCAAAILTELLAVDALKPKKITQAISELDVPTIAMVGHMPDLGHFAAWLLGMRVAIEFQKAGTIGMRFPLTPRKGEGELLWAVSPDWFSTPEDR